MTVSLDSTPDSREVILGELNFTLPDSALDHDASIYLDVGHERPKKPSGRVALSAAGAGPPALRFPCRTAILYSHQPRFSWFATLYITARRWRNGIEHAAAL